MPQRAPSSESHAATRCRRDIVLAITCSLLTSPSALSTVLPRPTIYADTVRGIAARDSRLPTSSAPIAVKRSDAIFRTARRGYSGRSRLLRKLDTTAGNAAAWPLGCAQLARRGGNTDLPIRKYNRLTRVWLVQAKLGQAPMQTTFAVICATVQTKSLSGEFRLDCRVF
jgi:hypothetical protein